MSEYKLLIRSISLLAEIENSGLKTEELDSGTIDLQSLDSGKRMMKVLAKDFNLVLSPSETKGLKNGMTLIEIIKPEAEVPQV